MPSPFPGMNPYLEQAEIWPDFHNTFLTVSRAMLNEAVGDRYFIKLEIRLYLETVPGQGGMSPVELVLPEYDEQSEVSIEILDRSNHRIVTVIEQLSPSNKSAAKDRQLYLSKRKHLLHSRTNFVEIDLLRGGHRLAPPELPECDYYALVHRDSQSQKLGFWPIRLRDALPTIPIPLAPPDEELKLDLQAVLHRVYDEAKFGGYIYSSPPEPRLSAEDQPWAKSILASISVGEPP